MCQWPVQVDPLDRAILDLLYSLPPVWDDYDAKSLTGSEQQAVGLMVRAGLVELRLLVRASMDSRDELVEMVVTVTGEYDATGIWRVVLNQVSDWLDADGRTRGRCRMWSDPQQIRLTDQGELARHDYENQTPEKPSTVCAFVRKIGFFAHRPPVPARIRVESCSTDTHSSQKPGPTVTAATAKATVGDITIHNNIQIDHGAIAEQVLSELNKRKDTFPSEPARQHESKAPTGKDPDHQIPKMNKTIRQAGASLEWVRRERPDLAPEEATRGRYTKEQYDYIRENGGPAYPLDEQDQSTVPSWETWSRYVREFLRLTEGRVNFPRRGRTGRSLVRPDEIDDPSDDN
ncbi:MAG TPA: hypothetical protein ENJ00_01320 [Phycisphaerales bacterium]|nr:hypothetical protein [Phycisphaerales bacterium]